MAAERKHTLRRIKAGDYLLLSNDTRTLWRISRYEDGPTHGLEDWPRDKELWGLWKWDTPIVIGETGIEVDNWDRWEFMEGMHGTRAESVNRAMEINPDA